MKFTVDALLARHDLTAPDGRLLHAYDVTDAEFAAMTEVLQPDGRLQWRPRIFVLWAAEEIRRNHSVGGLTWDFLLDRLGQRVQRGTGLEMVSDGLAFWHRPIRRRPSDGKRLYLYSLMAEGGLPDAFLSRDSGYASAVLGAIGDIERGVVAPGDLAALDRIAAHRGDALPAAFQSRETRELLRDLAMACVELRRALPDALGLEAALLWLDRSRPGWAERLPLRLSPKAREAILLPALSRQIERPSGGALAQRLLLPTDGGRAWAGALRILRGGLMPFGLLPKVDRALTLRLVASNGATLRASPDHGGWRLEAPRDVVIALEPWAPGILIAYADGVALGEVVVDPGLHEPGEFAQLWRLESPLAPHALIPAAGGRSRGERLWLLAAGPPVCSPGIICHVPLPGPGGQVTDLGLFQMPEPSVIALSPLGGVLYRTCNAPGRQG